MQWSPILTKTSVLPEVLLELRVLVSPHIMDPAGVEMGSII